MMFVPAFRDTTPVQSVVPSRISYGRSFTLHRIRSIAPLSEAVPRRVTVELVTRVPLVGEDMAMTGREPSAKFAVRTRPCCITKVSCGDVLERPPLQLSNVKPDAAVAVMV